MKTKRSFIYLSLLIVSSVFFTGCFYRSVVSSKTYREQDIATQENRVRKIYYFRRDLEKRTPFVLLTKTFLRSEDSSGRVTCNVYDVLTMNEETFRLNDKLYVIADEKSFPVIARQEVPESMTHTSADTETIMDADSNEVSIISGYSEDHYKYFRLSYALTPEIIAGIKNAGTVLFRYYAGPNMITVRLRGEQLDRLKALL